VRELLANVGRHADAHDVRVGARAEDGHVVVEVADDGCGMDDDVRRRAVAAGHVGLASISERVEALGGSVAIVSPARDGRGTVVTVRLPA
jgi:two-component system NarL family sensor kinase